MKYNIYTLSRPFTYSPATYESNVLTQSSWTSNFRTILYQGTSASEEDYATANGLIVAHKGGIIYKGASGNATYYINEIGIPEYYLEFPSAYDCPPEVIIFFTNQDTGIPIDSTEAYYRWPLKITKVTNAGVYIKDMRYDASASDDSDDTNLNTYDWSKYGLIYIKVMERMIIHDSDDPEGSKVISPELSLNFGEAGELKFDIYPGNPGYDGDNALVPYKSHIMVDRDDIGFWYGRVTNVETAFDLKKSVTCEGELNFLKDVAVGWNTLRYWFGDGNTDDDDDPEDGIYTTYDSIFAWTIMSYLRAEIMTLDEAGTFPDFTDTLRVIFDLPSRSHTDGPGYTYPYPVGSNWTKTNRYKFMTDDLDILSNLSEDESDWGTWSAGIYVKKEDINYDDRPYDILNTYFTDVFHGYLYTEIDGRGFHKIKFTTNPIGTGSQVIEYGENITDLTVKTDTTNLMTIWTPYSENRDGKEVWLAGMYTEDSDGNETWTSSKIDPTKSTWDPKYWSYDIYDSSDKYYMYKYRNNGVTAAKYLYGGYAIVSEDEFAEYGPLYSCEQMDFQTYYDDQQALLAQSVRALSMRARMPLGLSVTAVDRAEYDDSQDPLDLGYEYRIVSEPHSVDAQLILTEASLHLDCPQASEFGFGDIDTSASAYIAKRYGSGVNYSKLTSSSTSTEPTIVSEPFEQSGTIFIEGAMPSGTIIVVFPREFYLCGGRSLNVTIGSLDEIPNLRMTVDSTSSTQFKMTYSSTKSVRSFHVYWKATITSG